MNRRTFLQTATGYAILHSQASAEKISKPPLLSFGLLTDIQYADAEPAGERHYRASIPKLKAAIEDLSKENLAFTLNLGDTIDRKTASFDAVLPLLSTLGHKCHSLLGNHDFSVPDNEKSGIRAKLGMPHDFYSFCHQGVRIVMLDTNDISTYKHPAGDAATVLAQKELDQLAATHANNAQPWNGNVSQRQLEWLKQQLTAAEKAGEPVLLCGHHPLQPANGHELWNPEPILKLIKNHHCVRAYLCGHNHSGAETNFHGVPLITFKSILHQPDVTAYAVVRLFDDKLVIEGRGRETSRSIALRA